MIATRKKPTQCCHQSRRTLNAPFTKTAFCVLQGLSVNIYYLVKFSRHATFILDSPWYKCQFRNTGSFCKKQFMVTILYYNILYYNYKNLIEQNDFFFFLKKFQQKHSIKKILILHRKTSKLISLFKERMDCCASANVQQIDCTQNKGLL